MTAESARPWLPLTPVEVRQLFAGAPFHWWLAGGCAIDEYLGEVTRNHDDIDVLLLHRDHAAVMDWLSSWELWKAEPPGTLVPWQIGTALGSAVHDVWGRSNSDDAWRFQLMFDDSAVYRWQSRRNRDLSMPLDELRADCDSTLPLLRPAIILFYKAKTLRAKDQQDFLAVLPRLSAAERLWLAAAIRATYGASHEWLPTLARDRSGAGR